MFAYWYIAKQYLGQWGQRLRARCLPQQPEANAAICDLPAQCGRAHTQSQRARLFCASLGGGIVLALLLSVLQSQLAFATTCAEIRTDTLRLHIVANSNSVADQAIKLQVRDAILAEMQEIYTEASEAQLATAQSAASASESIQGSAAESEPVLATAQVAQSGQVAQIGQTQTALTQADSIALVQKNIARLALAATEALHAAGVQQAVSLTLTEMYFDTTVYDAYTLPAGNYTALRIELGAQNGRNWWCVLYPAICLASSSGAYTSAAENEIVCGDYVLRFAAVEWWEKHFGDVTSAE